jgi:hypothetical protein
MVWHPSYSSWRAICSHIAQPFVDFTHDARARPFGAAIALVHTLVTRLLFEVDLELQATMKKGSLIITELMDYRAPPDARTLVVLSGADVFVNAADVAEALREASPEVPVAFEPTWGHGGFLFLPDPQRIIERACRFVSERESPRGNATRARRSPQRRRPAAAS